MGLSVMECQKCGTSFWFDVEKGGALESGPCCFGFEVLTVEKYPTENLAVRAYPAWIKRRDAVIKQRGAARHG